MRIWAAVLLCACSSAAPATEVLPTRTPAEPAAPATAAASSAPVVAAPLEPEPELERAEAPRVRRTVQLTIMGAFPETLIPDIEAALRARLGVHVVPTRTIELPEEAFYAPRKRYRAEKLLAALERDQREGISQLGMTEVDISTTKGKVKDWGVFGLGMIGGTTSVISTHRLRKDKPREALYRFRVVSTAVHEAGHMLGLDHCIEPRCVMNDAEGSIKTVDQSTGELGPECATRLDTLAPLTSLATPR